MSLVLDASAAIAWMYGEAAAPELSRLYEATKELGAYVPQIWRVEIANVLLVGYRRGRYGLSIMEDHLADLALLRIAIDPETQNQAWDRIVELAVTHNLTSYDACYLELAARMRLPLATLDKQLMQAAPQAGVQLFWTQAAGDPGSAKSHASAD